MGQLNLTPQTNPQSVRVGILHSRSGKFASDEASSIQAVLMAIAQINQTGGVLGKTIEPILKDGASDSQEFQRQARTLLQDNQVNTLFGGWTSETRKAMLPVLEEFNALLWYPARYEGLEHSSQIFYTGTCPNQSLEPAIAWLLSQGKRHFYLLGSDDLFSKTVHQLLKSQIGRQGSRIVGEDYVVAEDLCFSSAIARIRQHQPDIVINTLTRRKNLEFYPQYCQSGPVTACIPTLAINLSEVELQHLKETAAGHYIVGSYFQSLNTLPNQQFIRQFRAQEGGDRILTEAAEAAYMQVYLWKQAVELAQSFESDRVRVAAYGQTFSAPGGTVTLEANHHTSKPCAIGRVDASGQLEIIFRSDRPIKPLPWLGVEAAQFKTSDILIDILSDLSHWMRQARAFERQSAQLQELEVAMMQLKNEASAYQQMEGAIRDYGAEVRALFTAMTDAIFVADAKGVYLRIAPTDPGNIHKPSPNSIGRSFHDIFPTEIADRLLSYNQEVLANQQSATFEYCLSAENSEEIWCSASLSPISQEAVVWVMRDITEQKLLEWKQEQARMELEQQFDERTAALIASNDQLIAEIVDRQQAVNALRSTKDQLQAILEAVPGIVSWISSDLRYLGVNRHLAQTFSLPPTEFVGKDIGFLQASSQFKDFVRSFFSHPIQDDFTEVSARVNGDRRTYLIAAQKYDEGKAAFTVGIDITERVRALEGLRRAEEKYRAIFENAVEGIFQTTLDGCYLSANPALARIYGYESPEQLMAKLANIEQLYVDKECRAEFTHLLQTEGSVVGFESQVYRQDGTITWISENARVVRDESGEILYYEGTVEDIFERKKAEEQLRQLNEELESRVERRTIELRELNLQLLMEIGERERIEAALRTSEAELRKSEAELKALFAAMTDVINVFDAQGQYIKIVSTNSELLYSPTPDRVGKTVREVFPPKIAELFVTHIRQALETGQTVNLEYNLTIREGDNPLKPEAHEVWFAASVSPLPDDCVIWVARNITERRRVLSALQEAEEKYRSIFENAAEGIFQTAPDGRYLSANPALVRMYGYDSFLDLAASLTNISQQLYVDRQQREALIARLEERGSVSDFQSQAYRKDGQIIWTSENVRAVRDKQGKTLYYEGTVQDITQRKLAEDALHLEREKSERLLLNILPQRIAEQLKQDQQAIAERFEQVTILFADIVDFTSISARISPTELVDLLNKIFSAFDQLAHHYGLEKIKTIGDAYMVAGGLPVPRTDNAEVVAEMALDMQREIQQFQRDDGTPFRLRIGINTGPVVAGVIGIKKFIYDLWGDAVNVASRMESHGVAAGIQVTQQTYELLEGKYVFERRGKIEIKGKGQMETYWLQGKRTSSAS